VSSIGTSLTVIGLQFEAQLERVIVRSSLLFAAFLAAV
jgi:hypothetical protein